LFASTTAYAAPVPFSVVVTGNTQRVWGHLVSSSYFSTLGVRPALGRYFDPNETSDGGVPLVVVSHRFWLERLGGEASVIGKPLRVGGRRLTVIGVAPPDFLGASPLLFPLDIWMTVSAGRGVAPELGDNTLERRDVKMFFVVGRLKQGISWSRAEAEIEATAEQFERDRLDIDKNASRRHAIRLTQGGKLFPIRKQDLPFFTSFFTIVAGLVMLIACSNVANMLLARAARRRREIAIRLAMGASRWRLIRQLLTESVVLAMAAGVVGFLGARWLMSLASQVQMPFPMPDAQVLLLTIALTLCTGILFGLAPAIEAAKTDVAPALKEGTNLLFRKHRRFSLRNLLIVWQVAGSLHTVIRT
jgi:predicted permease